MSFLDPATLLVQELVETAHSDNDYNQTYSHEMDFSNYQKVGNVAVPFDVSEKIAGQTTWSLALSAISFNSGAHKRHFRALKFRLRARNTCEWECMSR